MVGTTYASRVVGPGTRVRYRGAWLHSIDGEYVVDGPRFDYYRPHIAQWRTHHEATRSAVVDYWYHVYTPREGDTIIDIGAGLGVDVAVFSRSVGPRGRVLAIEAHPGTFALLRRVSSLNRWDNVRLVNSAVMDGPGTVQLSGPSGDEASTVGPVFDATAACSVRAESLDALVANAGIERIDLLKMNIEGAEKFAIRGMDRTIARTRHVAIACHDFRRRESDFYVTRDQVIAFLREHGFDIVVRDDDSRPYVRDHVHGVRHVPGAPQ